MFKFQLYKFPPPKEWDYSKYTIYYLSLVVFYIRLDFRIGTYAKAYTIRCEQYYFFKAKQRGKKMQRHYEKTGELPF